MLYYLFNILLFFFKFFLQVDRLYGWKVSRNAPIRMSMKKQSGDVMSEFNRRVTHVKCISTSCSSNTLFYLVLLNVNYVCVFFICKVITQFKEQGLNTELYYKNKEMGETFSIVPTSAIT